MNRKGGEVVITQKNACASETSERKQQTAGPSAILRQHFVAPRDKTESISQRAQSSRTQDLQAHRTLPCRTTPTAQHTHSAHSTPAPTCAETPSTQQLARTETAPLCTVLSSVSPWTAHERSFCSTSEAILETAQSKGKQTTKSSWTVLWTSMPWGQGLHLQRPQSE